MTVDWKGKHIAILSAAGDIHIHGHPSVSSCPVINSMQLGSLCRQGAVSHMVRLYQVTLGDGEEQDATPECVRAVLNQYADVFGEPEGLPPRRSCDHHIPLVPGAPPVNIHPYRHKPEHKTEIEEQVADRSLLTWSIWIPKPKKSSPLNMTTKGTRFCVSHNTPVTVNHGSRRQKMLR